MVRRSFRLGLWAGLVLGIGFALMKTMQTRRTVQQDPIPPPSRDPWPPVARTEPVAERPMPEPPPAAAVVEPEPEPEPAPEAAPEPAAVETSEEVEASAAP